MTKREREKLATEERAMNLEEVEKAIIRRAEELEEEHAGAPEWAGAEPLDFPAPRSILDELVQRGLLKRLVVEHLNHRVNLYRLAEKPGKHPAPDDLFDVIVGFEEIKSLFRKSMGAERVVHILLVGAPASAKSLFLLELNRLPGSFYALASSSSRAGLADLILQSTPRYLLIDELDKVKDAEDLSVLLSLMETGIVSEVKYRRIRSRRVRCSVYAAANRLDTLPRELLSRFLTLRIREYTPDEFLQVCQEVLTGREGVSPELAQLISRAVLQRIGSRDPRDAVRVARLAKTPKEVEEVVDWIRKHR